MQGVVKGSQGGGVDARLQYFAWRWYRIPGEVAEDIVQSAHLTYLEVRDRYPGEGKRPDLLLGIFRNKCREHIAQNVRAARAVRQLRSAAEAGETALPVRPEGRRPDGVLGDLVRRENSRAILDALAHVRPKVRRMFRLIAAGATRQDLIRAYCLNKNTLDSRLRAYRGELRRVLAQRGVPV